MNEWMNDSGGGGGESCYDPVRKKFTWLYIHVDKLTSKKMFSYTHTYTHTYIYIDENILCKVNFYIYIYIYIYIYTKFLSPALHLNHYVSSNQIIYGWVLFKSQNKRW
jgi:hypothetical protein